MAARDWPLGSGRAARVLGDHEHCQEGGEQRRHDQPVGASRERHGGEQRDVDAQPCGGAVAPATTTLSPTAMITNSSKRSLKRAPSICHWLIGVVPAPGSQ
jgi:hypothetical protein